MHFVRHPFFERDLIGMVDHIVDVTGGDVAAAERRLDEVDGLLDPIASNPTSGVRLSGRLRGWLVHHGGSGQRLTIVFKPDIAGGVIYLALAAFGARDWVKLASGVLIRSETYSFPVRTLLAIHAEPTRIGLPLGELTSIP